MSSFSLGSIIKSEYDYEDDFDDFESIAKNSDRQAKPVKEHSKKFESPEENERKEMVTPTNKNMFMKPNNPRIENTSIRSSAQDSVAMTIKGNSFLQNSNISHTRSPYNDKKKADYFDQRAKPVANRYNEQKRLTLKEEKHESSDYGEDFELDHNESVNEVADNILRNVKPKTTKVNDTKKEPKK
jgi:hypothetical protein